MNFIAWNICSLGDFYWRTLFYQPLYDKNKLSCICNLNLFFDKINWPTFYITILSFIFSLMHLI